MTEPEVTGGYVPCVDYCMTGDCRSPSDCIRSAPKLPVPAPSDEAKEALRRIMRSVGWTSWVADAAADALAAAYAIDFPLLLAKARAEGEATRTAEIVAWLWTSAPVARPWQREQIADAVAARFNPEAE